MMTDDQVCVYRKRMGLRARVAVVVPAAALVLLLTAIAGTVAGGPVRVPAAACIAALTAAVVAMLAPLDLRVTAEGATGRRVSVAVHFCGMAVIRRKLECDRLEIRPGVIGLVLDEIDICGKTLLCVRGDESRPLISKQLRWWFEVSDRAIEQIHASLDGLGQV